MALPNGDLITTVFDPQMAYPVDKRMQVDTLNSRDSMSMFIRWEGMEVYVLENKTKYILQGGRSNEFWKEQGTGSGTGGTTFVGQFPAADLLPTTGRSAGDYAFVGTGDDFVQYNWDNIANQWVMAEGQTDMASEFFHIGYKTPLRRPVIFPLFPKDVVVETSGDFVFAPETAVARFIFTGEVTAIRGIETAEADREIKLVNRTGSDIPLRDKASGIPSDSGFDFGGTDYTWVNGSEITLKGNGTYWELAPNNQIAFSDHLDSVNAQVSVGSDGMDVWSDIIDKFTGKKISLKEITKLPNGQVPTDAILNNMTLFKIGDKYLMNSDLINAPVVNVKLFGAKGDWQNDDTSAIQQACNFAKSIGASVYAPAGNYRLTDTIQLFHSCVFYGDGKKTTVFRSEITGDKDVLEFFNSEGSAAGVTIFGFSIHGKQDGSGTEGYGIRIHNSNVNTLKDLYVRFLGGGAVWISDTYVNYISDCYFGFNSRNITYRNTENAVVHVPYFPGGNGLYMERVYISNNPDMDGVFFVGYNGNFTMVTVESGRDGIVLGRYNSPTCGVNINTCYFENSGRYDIRIIEAYNLQVNTTFHGNYPSTVANVFISNLRNAEFNNCAFDDKGIHIDTDNLRSRNNILFKQCVGVFFDTVNLSGIKVENEVSVPERLSNTTTNLLPYSDDLSKWTLNNDASISQDAIFLDGSPAWTVVSPSNSDSVSYSLGSHTGAMCFSAFVKIKTVVVYSRIQMTGRRKSDNVLETVGYTRLRNITLRNIPEWERVFVAANVDHNDLSVAITGLGEGVEICRMEFQKGTVKPSAYPAFTNGWIVTSGKREVVNGDTLINGKLSVFGDSNSPYSLDIDSNGHYSLIPSTNQIADVNSLIQTGYYSTSGNKVNSATSYSLAPQKIVSHEQMTVSGVGGLATSVARIIYFDSQGNYLSNVMSTAASERVITFTPPANADTFAVNIIISSSQSIDVFRDSVMLNYGSTAFPVDVYAPKWKFDYQGNGGKFLRLREDERGIDFVDNIAPNASTSQRGIIEQATDAETITGTDTERAVSPANLQAKLNALILSATATLDFPTIAAGETERLTATVTGAALLDPVLVSGPDNIYNSNDSTIDAWVSAADTVTVRVRNNGASSIDPGEGQFKIKVFK